MTAQNHQKKSKKIIEIFRDGVNFMQLQRWGVISPEASSLFQEVSAPEKRTYIFGVFRV